MPEVKLRDLLENDAAARAERMHVRFGLNDDGKVWCATRDSSTLGIGRTRLMAFLDWEDKMASTHPTED